MPWRFLVPFSANSASGNLAIDEAIARCGIDTIRFYSRSRPALALGYSKPFTGANGVDVVRRITGGGTTYHDKNDLTYSIVSGKIESYEGACAGLLLGLRNLGINACFKEPNDVLVGGKKISGCAQARRFGTVLHQGTLLIGKVDGKKMREFLPQSSPQNLTSVEEALGKKTGPREVISALKPGFEEAFGRLKESGMTDEEKSIAGILEKNRYSFGGWTRNRDKKTLRLHVPGDLGKFPSISVTGQECAMKCRHCGGRLLKSMVPAKSPGELLDFCRKLKENGGEGCLISGGCTPAGGVPLEKLLGAIAEIKKLGLKVVVHTGLVDLPLAMKLKAAGVDSALVDVFGSDESIGDVVGKKFAVRDYEDSLKALKEAKVPTVPHVLVGLHFGKLKGELEALKMMAKYAPNAVVVIASQKIGNWKFEPTPEDVAFVIREAKMLMPMTPVALGCMRPKGEERARIDVLALQEGVDAIAHPHKKAVELAENLGIFEIRKLDTCCAEKVPGFNHSGATSKWASGKQCRDTTL